MIELNSREFSIVLERAISGDQLAITDILELYATLIDGASYIKGKLDEDLRQYILLHIIKNISKFKI